MKYIGVSAVLDITAHTREHVENLVNALGKFGDYITVTSFRTASVGTAVSGPVSSTVHWKCGM